VSRTHIRNAKRIVIKIGTRVLTEKDNSFSYSVAESIVKQVSEEININSERKFIIVSSGAIALGLSRMGLPTRPREINLLQAAASLGQSRLMHAYETIFNESRYETAQILLTYEDIQNRTRYLNIRNTIFTLWSFNVIPIVNENDTVSYAEIRFGDNDIIAAYLSIMIDADLLIILTDTEGVFDRSSGGTSGGQLLNEISRINSEVKRLAAGKGSMFSSGGMESKLQAAEIATKSGVGVIIGGGRTFSLRKLLDGETIGTYCVPSAKRIRGKKKWIAFNPRVDGKIVIDRGGEHAIVKEQKSLLPAGVKEVKGKFEAGGNVSVQNEEQREIARGLTNFSSEELNLIKGFNTRKIPAILGVDTYFEEVIHRDNMVILV
jgi:glutamate 5-kinase